MVYVHTILRDVAGLFKVGRLVAYREADVQGWQESREPTNPTGGQRLVAMIYGLSFLALRHNFGNSYTMQLCWPANHFGGWTWYQLQHCSAEKDVAQRG
jgi:hypothetical protein